MKKIYKYDNFTVPFPDKIHLEGQPATLKQWNKQDEGKQPFTLSPVLGSGGDKETCFSCQFYENTGASQTPSSFQENTSFTGAKGLIWLLNERIEI